MTGLHIRGGLPGSLAANVAHICTPVVDLVFPPRCTLCGTGIAAQTGLCADCWADLDVPGDPACSLCSRPLAPHEASGLVCLPCLADPPAHDGVVAATLYNDASRKLLMAFKHGGKIALVPMLGRLISARLGELDSDWVIVPVPLHRWRLWRRGYNQAALLAREIARGRAARLSVDTLVRKKATPMLRGLGAEARAQALSGAIGISARGARVVRGANVILVDDVLTSGATSGACVSALKQAGAKAVKIACFSRVINHA